MNAINFGARVGLQAKPDLFVNITPAAKKIIKIYKDPNNLKSLFKHLNDAINVSLQQENDPNKKLSLTNDELSAPEALKFIMIGCSIDEFMAIRDQFLTIIQHYNHKIHHLIDKNPKAPFHMKFYEFVQVRFEVSQARYLLLYFLHNQATALVGQSDPKRIKKYDQHFENVLKEEPFMKWLVSNVDHPNLSNCSATDLMMVAIRITDFLVNPGGQLQSSGLPMNKKQRDDAIGKLEWHAVNSAFCYM